MHLTPALAPGRGPTPPGLLAALGLVAALSGPGVEAADARALGLFPVQNRPGDSPAAAAVGQALQLELARFGRLVAPEETRNALRRLRIRNPDFAAPLLLRRLGEELAADWLVAPTLHDADRYLAPSLTVSVRVYSGRSGEVLWAGFRGACGLDGRKLLGLGTIPTVEGLARVVVRDLLRDLPAATEGATGSGGAGGEPRGPMRAATVAVVPFAASTSLESTRSAETVTEAARARLSRDGVRQVSPNRIHEVLRRLQGGQWGGVTAETRAALVGGSGADTILTGAVETYELGGSEAEPEPLVSIALRLLEASTGRIVWTGSSERQGWDRQGLFRRGRVHSRGALTEQMIEGLFRRLERERAAAGRRPEGAP